MRGEVVLVVERSGGGVVLISGGGGGGYVYTNFNILLEFSVVCAKIQFLITDVKRKVSSLNLKVEIYVNILIE